MRAATATLTFVISVVASTSANAGCYQQCRPLRVMGPWGPELRQACNLVCVADQISGYAKQYQTYADQRFGPRVDAMRNNAAQTAYPYPQIMGPPRPMTIPQRPPPQQPIIVRRR